MKIEAGKYYKTRDGRMVGPIKRSNTNDVEAYWHSDDRLSGYFAAWHEDGSFWPEGSQYRTAENAAFDLISPAYPEQGTLKEIGAKPGDVVELVEWEDGNDEHGAFAVGKHYTHTGMKLDSGIGYFMIREAGGHIFRIISRASDEPTSPARTVTIARQEIVPGVYGKVSVHQLRGDDGEVFVAMVQHHADKERTIHAIMTADELTAAIQTLTKIRDAMTA